MNNTICFFSFGNSHVFFDELIKNRAFINLFQNPKIIFIAPNRTHKIFFEKNSFKVFYLNDIDLSISKKFVKSDNESISTQKKSIINLSAKKQEQIYFELECFSLKIFEEEKVNYLIYSQAIEGLHGIILAKNAKNLGIHTFVPHACRFLNKSFFSSDQYENLNLICDYNTLDFLFAENLIKNLSVNKKENVLTKTEFKHKPFLIRLYYYFLRLIKHERFDLPRLKVSIENNLGFLYEIFYSYNRFVSLRYFQKNIENIHQKIIFYPLQYSPESSINIPNSYFVDQDRLIDLIRFNMPNDYLLYIKEHPSMFGRRARDFYKKINKKSGVRMLSPSISSLAIIDKSDLIISVSGTACLEAFLLKKPSITFGKTFFSELTNIYGINYNDLKATLKKYLLRKITDKEILEGIARVSANTYDFQIGAVEFDSRLYAKKNIDSFITALEKEFEVRSIKENN